MDTLNVAHKRELIEQSRPNGNANGKELHFKHVNVRQSITLLLIKLMVFELISAVCVVIFHLTIINLRIYDPTVIPRFSFHLSIFLILVAIKIFITSYIILEWHEEYYEISAHSIGHYRGYLFKRHENISFKHIASIKLEQDLLGKAFNYGTIRLHSWFLGKDYFLYQIHNPFKYLKVLEDQLPGIDKMTKTIRDRAIIEDES